MVLKIADDKEVKINEYIERFIDVLARNQVEKLEEYINEDAHWSINNEKQKKGFLKIFSLVKHFHKHNELKSYSIYSILEDNYCVGVNGRVSLKDGQEYAFSSEIEINPDKSNIQSLKTFYMDVD